MMSFGRTNTSQVPTHAAALHSQVLMSAASTAISKPQIKKTIAARAMPLHGL
jgi:hypothetical protein